MNTPVILSMGELLVEFVSHKPGCDLKDLTEYSGPYPSGAPAICIDQAARMGTKTKIFGALGQDNFGEALIDRLQANGVDTTSVLRLKEKTTGVAFVSYYIDGNRTFIFHLTDTAADSVADLKIDLPQEPVILHISGSSLGNKALRESIEKLAETVKAQGGKISCDPNARVELMSDPDAFASLLKIIEQSDYLFPSEVDLTYLSPGKSEEQAIASLLSSNANCVVLTKGKDGCSIYQSEQVHHLPSYDVEEIDPTGAGDCFCGTFLALLAQGKSLETCGQFANAAGAIAVTKRGPMEGNSDVATLTEFMQTHSPV